MIELLVELNAIQSRELLEEGFPALAQKISEKFHLKSFMFALKENTEDVYIEQLSFGLNEDFYYEFLSKEKGFRDKILQSSTVYLFDAKKFNLAHSDAEFALSRRVFKDEILGFIIIECANQNLEFNELLLYVLTEYFASIYSNKKMLKFTSLENSFSSNLFDVILDGSTGFSNSLQANRFFYIQGGSKVGKKTFVKYIKQKLNLNGELVFTNSIPENESKLYSQMKHWIELSKNGILIIEDASNLSELQQKVLFQFLVEPVLNPRIVFLDYKFKHKETYLPFWNLLKQHTLRLPELVELSSTHLRQVIEELFRYLKLSLNRNSLQISEEAYEFLLSYNYKENLKELEEMVRVAILQTKGNLISKNSFKLDLEIEEDLDLRAAVQNLERQKVLQAYKKYNGNQIKMAKALGISRGSLQYKMKQMELT